MFGSGAERYGRSLHGLLRKGAVMMFKRHMSLMTGAAILTLSAGAAANVPEYTDFQLQARANFTGAFNLPDGAFPSGPTVRVNDAAEVTFKVNAIPGGDVRGVWFGGNGDGQIVYTSPTGASMGDPSLSNAGFVVFDLSYVTPDGLFFYDATDGSSGFLTDRPIGASYWGSPTVNDAGNVGYRASFGSDHAFVSYDGGLSPAYHALEATLDATSPYSYLFTPAFNNARQIAGKVRLGPAGQYGESQPDEIRLFDADGSSTLIAEDVDSNSASPYTRFYNGVAVNDTGWVAFTAYLAAGGRGIFLSDGITTRTVVTTVGGEVSDIEFFTPAVNNAGLVTFRAFDTAGLRAVWAGDGVTLRRVVTEHDILPTDLGPARIDEHLDSNPVFGGGLSINAYGDIAFYCSLTPPDDNQIEWGSGAFVARGPRFEPGDLNCDGLINYGDIDPFVLAITDSANYATTYPDCDLNLADVNSDGQVNYGDIDPFVALLTGL